MQARTRRSCAVCGSDEIESDEVLEGGMLRLAACVRCQHRWTERPLLVALNPGTDAEVAVAA